MKILFVSSGNNKFENSPIVRNQGESLKKLGVDVDYFLIVGKGVPGYVRNVFRLRKFIKHRSYDLIHAHYSLSGIVAGLASRIPIITSLMGSDVHSSGIMRQVIRWFSRKVWSHVIIKSKGMSGKDVFKQASIIPNGVDLDHFKPIDKERARKKVNFNNQKHVLFVANPKRKEKNYALAKQAFALLNDESIELNVVSGVPYQDIPDYFYAADVLLLTSLWEGSPNVVKEAMACNMPIVSTIVGDVREIVGNTQGCFLASYDPWDMAQKIRAALLFGKRTNGREMIKHLDSKKIAREIMEIYENVIRSV